ncbi:MAG TPA: signal peptidase II [Acidiferrobacterales bacterium]|nr:signal peptidase II [Acidiferrobacterales bacterium]
MFRLSWITLLVFILDQLTKYMAIKNLVYHVEVPVTSFLSFTLLYNSGAAFSFLSNAGGWQNIFFIVIATAVSVIIFFIIRRLGMNDIQTAIALMMILGGAVGNLLDRLRFGYVVDFIDFHFGAWHWYAFNIADAAISTGAVFLLLDALGIGLRKKQA